MNISCPHCAQTLELTPEVQAQFQGQPQFACPVCQGFMAVPPLPASVSKQAPRRPAGVQKAAMHAQHGLNRNMLILGVIALLALGGLATFLASRNGGSVFNIFQNTTNQIIHNSYFTQLIAKGVTTEKDLQAMAEIRALGDDFIGISKEPLTWTQAQDLAKRTASAIMPAELGSKEQRMELTKWLATTFPKDAATAMWTAMDGKAGVWQNGSVQAATATDSSRRVLLHWFNTEAKRNLLESVFSKHGTVKILQGGKIIEVTRAEDLPAGSFQLNHVDQFKGDFDDADAAMLAKFPELTSIRLHRCSVTSLPLAALPELQNLELQECQVKGESLRLLAGCSKLSRVHLTGDRIGRSIVGILAKCPNLENVSLRGGIDLQDGDLEPLAQLTRLKEVHLSANLSDAGLAVLAGIPTLEYVELIKLNPDTVTLATLQQLPVTRLVFYVTTFTRAMLENIAKMPKLRSLRIDAGKIAEESLQPLFGMKQLETITLINLPLSAAAVDELKKALPNVKVNVIR